MNISKFFDPNSINYTQMIEPLVHKSTLRRTYLGYEVQDGLRNVIDRVTKVDKE